MPLQPDDDERIAKTSGRLASNGGRLLAVGVVLYLIGAILMLADISTIGGLMCIGLATPPTLGAIALFASGALGRRSSQHKPYA